MAVGKGGYVGLVRVEDGGLNAAAAFERRFLRVCGGPAGAASRILSGSGFPAVSAFGEAEWRGTVALTRTTRPVAADRVFLIGDATGYVEPFTGEGMAWALDVGPSRRGTRPAGRRRLEPGAWRGRGRSPITDF